MAVVPIEEGFRLVLLEEVRADLQVGDEVIVIRKRGGRIPIAPTSGRGDLNPGELLERLQETFGLWADRDDIPNDSIAYVDASCAGARLDEANRHFRSLREHRGRPLKEAIASQRENILIRRHILEPGEALPWHTDLCHRFSVVIRGDALGIEYQESGEVETFAVYPGMADWDAPQSNVHRGVNVGKGPYEEVVIFFLDKPGMEPQPEAGEKQGPPSR